MAENVLICGVNWLGDGMMSMPAIQLFREENPSARITLMMRAGLVPLWRMCGVADGILEYRKGMLETVRAARRVREESFDRAFVFPNSLRSALIPLLGRVPQRIGFRGHERAWLLTQAVELRSDWEERHQSWEYVEILGLVPKDGILKAPSLSVPADDTARMVERLTGLGVAAGARRVGLMPGAARGPSKRWPAEHFAEAGRILAKESGCRVLIFGTAEEREACAAIAGAIGPEAVNLAGETSLTELAAGLSLCRVAVCNDSGGMHLAAASGARVAAVFGVTDPRKTGPMGEGHRVITDGDATHHRDIKRDSADARECLRGISPERVASAALELLAEGSA